MAQLHPHKLLTSQNWSCIEYLTLNYSTLVLFLHSFLARNLAILTSFNKNLLINTINVFLNLCDVGNSTDLQGCVAMSLKCVGISSDNFVASFVLSQAVKKKLKIVILTVSQFDFTTAHIHPSTTAHFAQNCTIRIPCARSSKVITGFGARTLAKSPCWQKSGHCTQVLRRMIKNRTHIVYYITSLFQLLTDAMLCDPTSNDVISGIGSRSSGLSYM